MAQRRIKGSTALGCCSNVAGLRLLHDCIPAGLQNIPTEVIEASRIDGARSFQRFRFITLPLIVPAITISLFLTIANALKSFDLIYAMVDYQGTQQARFPLFSTFTMRHSPKDRQEWPPLELCCFLLFF